MLCFRYKRLLVPYAEGTLDDRTSAGVEKHLASCDRCRAELACVKSVSDALRRTDVPASEPASDLWARVKEQIEAEPAPVRASRLPQVAYTLAAFVFIGVLGWSLIPRQSGSERVTLTAKAGTARRAADVAPKDAAPKPASAPTRPAVAEQPAQVAKRQPLHKRAQPVAGGSPAIKPEPPVVMAAVPQEDRAAADRYDEKSQMASNAVAPSPAPPPAAAAAEVAAPRDQSPAADTARSSGGSLFRSNTQAAPGSGYKLEMRSSPPALAQNNNTIIAKTIGVRNLSADEYLNIGNSQIVAGQKDEAANNFYNALTVSKPGKWRVIANNAKQVGALDQVATNASNAFANNRDPRYGRMLYEVQSVQNNQTGMLNTAQQLVVLEPKSAVNWLKLGEAYEAAGNTTKALEAYDKAAAGSDSRTAALAKKKAARLRKTSAQTQQ
jgi:anti-sigma factor RsiW